MELVKYNAACKALSEATKVDEVKHILDVSSAMKAYATQAVISRPWHRYALGCIYKR
jgi:hypothetical protein